MLKKIQNVLKYSLMTKLVPLCTLIFIINAVAMEPSRTKKLATKNAALKTYHTKLEDIDFSCNSDSTSEEMDEENSYEQEGYIPSTIKTGNFSLANFNYKSASVLTLYTHNDKEYVILTREGRGMPQSKGGKKYTYDDFSGGRSKGETHPIQTAAHEFLQEAILEQILKWDLKKTENFIDPTTKTTLFVIASSQDKNENIPNSRDVRNVTYIVNFDKYADDMFDKFYDALNKEKERYKQLGTPKKHQATTEKDKIATILWDDLKKAIINQEDPTKPIRIQAQIKERRKNSFYKKQITIRPFLAIKLRPFLLGKPYEQGENEKIRYYKIEQ